MPYLKVKITCCYSSETTSDAFLLFSKLFTIISLFLKKGGYKKVKAKQRKNTLKL
jgi:hypothetical protein